MEYQNVEPYKFHPTIANTEASQAGTENHKALHPL